MLKCKKTIYFSGFGPRFRVWAKGSKQCFSEEVLEQGHLDLAETDKLLLQKIEELTLYLLDMQAENKKLSEKIEALENKLNNQ